MKRETIDPAWLKEASQCAKIVSHGHTLLYPSETMWGLGCDAQNLNAVNQIAHIKQRPDEKSFITLVSSWRMLQNVVQEIPSVAEEILELSSEPITIIYPAANSRFQHLCSDDGKIAVRLVENAFASLIMDKSNSPLISTSANISGEHFSGDILDVSEEIIENVDYAANRQIDYKLVGKASKLMMIDLDGKIKILR